MSSIIAFDGPLSGGKTKTAIEFLKMDLADGKRLISNIHLIELPHTYIPSEDLADFILKNHTEDKFSIIEQMFSFSSLFIDEIKTLLASTRKSSNLNEVITQFLMLLGKLDCDLYYTLQRFMMVDIDVRKITDYRLKCIRLDNKGRLYSKYRIPYITPDGKIIPEQQINLYPNSKLMPIFINVRIYEVISESEIKYTGKQFTYNPLDSKQNYNTRELVIVDRDKYKSK